MLVVHHKKSDFIYLRMMDIQNPLNSIVGPSKVKKVESKYSIRKNVWSQLWKDKLVEHPVPFGRIPNFLGAEVATKRLAELDAFKMAKSVEVSPDKPLASARALALENGKDLFVACPSLQKGLMKKLELDSAFDTNLIVSHWGIENKGKKIDVLDKVLIDLIVMGSVAVSKNGYRIGKGKGYSDMKFALLKEMKALHDQIVIVTIVHDSQVYDELPKSIFKKYDVPIDYILTPTQTIEVKHEIPRPEQIFWNELTHYQINMSSPLLVLKQKLEREGKNTTLKICRPWDRNCWPQPQFFDNRFYSSWRPVNSMSNFSYKKVAIKKNKDIKSESTLVPPKTASESNDNSGIITGNTEIFGDDTKITEENTEIIREHRENQRPPVKSKKKKKSKAIYSLRIGNIQKCVRVRDLKNALMEEGIRPNYITWKGSKGVCYLHYKRKNRKTSSSPESNENSEAINNVIELIQNLKLNPNSERVFTVRIMEPITRVETVDITSV